MFLTLILLSIFVILYYYYNGNQIKYYLIIGLVLIVLHSLMLPFFGDSAFAGSDTLAYYEVSLKLKNNVLNSMKLIDALCEANRKSSYWGYYIFNSLSVFGENSIASATFIRINNFLVYLITLLLMLEFLNKRKINVNSRWNTICILAIKIVFLWYSMYNLRDGIVLSLTICYTIFILDKKYIKLIFTIALLFFFREIMVITLILGSVIIFLIKKLKLKTSLVKTMLIISISFYFVWAIIPPPNIMNNMFGALLRISSEDVSNYNELNIEMYKLLDVNPKKVGNYISSRYLKRLPALIFPANPLKKLFMVVFEEKALFTYSPISLILECTINLINFTFVPMLIFIAIKYKAVTLSYEMEIISGLAVFMIFAFLGTYLIKFGYAQLRQSFTIFPLLFLAGTFFDVPISNKPTKIIIATIMFLLMIVLFALKPYLIITDYL